MNTLRILLLNPRSRVALACTLASMLLLAIAPAAIAQDERAPQSARVVAVDMSTEPQAVIVRASGDAQDAQVAVNGERADVTEIVPAGSVGYGLDEVVIVDNSSTSAPRLDALKAAATAYVEGFDPSSVRMSVMSLPAQRVLDLNSDPAAVANAIDGITSTSAAAIYDALATAAQVVDRGGVRFHEITLVVASGDDASTTTAAIARAQALSARARINVIALVSNDFPVAQTGVYQQLAAETGGYFVVTDDPAKLPELAAGVGRDVRDLRAVQFETSQADKGGNVELTIGGQYFEVGFVPNVLTQGSALADLAGEGSSGLPFLSVFEGDQGLLLILVLGAVAAGLLAYAIALLATKQDDGLKSVLEPYTPGTESNEKGGLSKSAILQRAVNITTSLAERQGVLVKAEKMLEQADMPLRAGEALTAYVGIVIGAAVLGFLLQRNLLWLLAFAVLGALIPPAVVNFKAGRRRKKFTAQLPDTLQLLAGTLKAGYSFMQGVEAVSREIEDPMGAEFRRVVTEAQLGRPVEEALEASAQRMNSPDFEWAVMAVRIQREVGGNLAELLMTVAETMTARQRLRGEVMALTAEGRVSALVLGILPLGLGFMLWTINPEYMSTLFDESIGRFMLLGSALLAGAGFVWMKKIIDIRI
ncbi:MAG TPA: type II secretion system F family protein [Acidimicrobiales bacterium]